MDKAEKLKKKLENKIKVNIIFDKTEISEAIILESTHENSDSDEDPYGVFGRLLRNIEKMGKYVEKDIEK